MFKLADDKWHLLDMIIQQRGMEEALIRFKGLLGDATITMKIFKQQLELRKLTQSIA